MPRNATTGIYSRPVNSFSDPVLGEVIDPNDAGALFDDQDSDGFNNIPSQVLNFKVNATGGVQRTLLNKLSDIVSVKDFGATGDGGTDDTAAFQAAATWANSFAGTAGAAVYVPPGSYLISTAIPVTARVSWFGAGANAHIYQSSETEHVFNVTGGNTTIRDLQISSTVNKSAGAAIKVAGGGGVFENLYLSGAPDENGLFNGIEVDSGAFWYVINSRINNVVNCGVLVYGANDLGELINVTVDGAITRAGLKVTSIGDMIVVGCNFVGTDRGMWLIGSPATYLMQVSQVGCDHNRVGIEIDGGTGGTSGRHYFTDVQTTSCVEDGVLITGTGLVDDIELTTCKSHDNGTGGTGSGVNIATTSSVNITLRGCTLAHNTTAGVDIAANVNKVTISDSIIGPVGEWGANGYGVRIASGTSTNIEIVDSDLSGNTTANLSNLSTGSDVRIINVKGADPVLTPSQITSDQNNYAPVGIQSAQFVDLSSDAVRNITGIVAPAYQKTLTLFNRGAFKIILNSGSGSSSAVNRFAFPSADVPIMPNSAVPLIYDTAATRWLLAGFALPAGNSGVLNTDSSGAVSVTSNPTLGASGVDGSVTMGNATSGTLKLQPATGALGTSVISVPAGTDTLVTLNGSQTLTNKSIAATQITGNTPTQQRFTSGSGTYTTPAGCKAIRIFMVGGGGGGGGSGSGSGNGGNGGNTTFGTLTAGGGSGASGSSGTGGSGGSASNGDVNLSGGWGVSTPAGLVNFPGGSGGSSAFGGAGVGGYGAQSATAGATNTGGGGGGGIGNASVPGIGGGGAGGYCEKLNASPSATYSYSVGAGGSAGTAGTSGGAGGAGGSGIIIVDEYY